jgi:CHAT domain-containing protein/cytochrome c-type biogenesis protein CcmH/NrfG
LGRSSNAHLTMDEIDWLLTLRAGAEPTFALQPEDPDEVQAHLTACAECRQTLQQHESFGRRLAALKEVNEPVRTPQCPPDGAWAQLAAGLSAPEISDGLLAHAAHCDHCGALLREVSEGLASDLRPEEENMVAALLSSQPGGRKRLAQRLSQVSAKVRYQVALVTPPSRAARLRPRWIYAAAAAVMLTVMASWFFFWQRAGSPAQLLASAYGELRTLEPRIPLARYGPMRVERGLSGGSRMNAPPSLSEAEAKISRKLQANPDDAEWLALKARADLLDWSYESSIRAATRALEQRPDSPSVLIDLATAHFERAEKEQRALDYGTAVELLGTVLAKNPDNLVAVFNRAITYEKLSLYHEALADWEHYLKADPTGNWADEARGKRDAVAKLLRERENHSLIQADPAHFMELAARDPEIVSERVEVYLDQAVMKWLPDAFPLASSGPPGAQARTALPVLAKLSTSRHGDQWLEDLLSTTPSPAFAKAVASLAGAVNADAEGDWAHGQEDAAAAERWFQSAGSAAGVFRARLERLYALDRAGQGQSCLDGTRSLMPQLAGHRYPWLLARLQLRLAACLDSLGKQGDRHLVLEQTRSLVESAGYPDLRIQVLARAAAFETMKGNRRKAWALDVQGLKLFWGASYPPVAAYRFYADMAIAAENSGQWKLAVALNREAAHAISSTRNRTAEALAWFELGKAATMAGVLPEARQALALADRSFSQLPDDRALDFYRAECDIGFATIAMRDGRTEQALARLKQARMRLAHIQNYFMISDYFRALSEARQRAGREDGAELATRSQVAVAELALGSLRGERERQVWNREMAEGYYRMIETRWDLHNDPEGALEIWEWYRGASLRARAADAGPLEFLSIEARPVLPPLHAVKELAGTLATQTVLSYAVLPRGVAIWIADDRGISGTLVRVSRDELRLLISRFYAYCSDPASDSVELRRLARRLYDLLILPVESRLATDRLLLVELDSSLSSMPIQALMDSHGEYLGSKFAIADFPGIAYLRHLRPVIGITGGDRALVIGSPTMSGAWSSSLPPLPDAAAEAEGIASKFHNGLLLTGKLVTAAAVKRELPGVVVFHYAGHSTSNAERVGLSMADASGGETSDLSDNPPVLEAASFDNSRIPRCSLAVFSACETEGVERDGTGDPESLVRVFLNAGVPQVVASRWNVDSNATALFMNAFYDRLLHGQPAAVAIRAIASDIRKQPAGAHPYYWAAFSLYGRG